MLGGAPPRSVGRTETAKREVHCLVRHPIAAFPTGERRPPTGQVRSRPCAFIIIGKQKIFDLHFLDSPGDNDPDFKYPLPPNTQLSFIHIHIHLSQCVLPANLSKPMAPTATPPMAQMAQMVLPTATTMALPASRHATTLVLTTSAPTSP